VLIADKVAWAEDKYSGLGNKILKDAQVKNLLNKLDAAIKSTYNCMLEVGVVRECTKCALHTGSCCGKGIDDRYDEITLLINRLFGVELPSKRADPESCFFLGPNGCTLKAREVICVNYLCEKILRSIDPKKINHLQMVVGEELETLFILKERIRKILGGYS
jgi:hypothetical protein